MALKFFFSADGFSELDTDMNGISAGTCGALVEYKGRKSDRHGRGFRRSISGYIGTITQGKRVTLTAASFGGRPVLVKLWAPKGHTMQTESFWLVP